MHLLCFQYKNSTLLTLAPLIYIEFVSDIFISFFPCKNKKKSPNIGRNRENYIIF